MKLLLQPAAHLPILTLNASYDINTATLVLPTYQYQLLTAWGKGGKFPKGNFMETSSMEISMAIIKTMETSQLTFVKGSFFQISKNQYNFYASFRKFPEIVETLLKYISNVMVVDYLNA